jgi:PKD repeat protein
MIKDLTKLATFLEEEQLSKEAGELFDMISSTETPPEGLFDDVKVAASYPGNMGAMEMFQFQRDATPAQIKVMDRLLDEDRTSEAWDFLKKTTGTDLHDPSGYKEDHSKTVIETIGNVKIYRNADWGEYIVVPEGGNVDEDGYHTDDLEDAVDTAKAMSREDE